jgi:hypothetical protein
MTREDDSIGLFWFANEDAVSDLSHDVLDLPSMSLLRHLP